MSMVQFQEVSTDNKEGSYWLFKDLTLAIVFSTSSQRTNSPTWPGMRSLQAIHHYGLMMTHRVLLM